MRKFFKNLMIGMVTLVGGFMTSSCDNSLTYEPNPNDSIQVQLVHTPDVIAYSGEEVLGSTFGIRTMNLPVMYMTRSEEPTFTKWQSDTKIEGWPEKTDRDQAVSTQEFNYVMQYLENHPNEGSLECDVMPYFLQLVGKSGVTYHLDFMNGEQVHHSTDIVGSNQMDYFELNGVHISDYNGSAGPWVYVENLPLINPRYHESYANLTQENHYRFYTIPNEDGNGSSLYLCFDYATSKYDNGQLDFDGDGVYNDWVIKIIPGNNVTTPPNTNENCDKCGHPQHGEYCDECVEGDDCYKDSPVIIPDNTEVPEHVEVNLSIDKKEGVKWLASHLSIHVRANTDVEVFIPIPVDYVCEADDLAIVQKHRDDLMVHGGPESVTYTINGHDITLTINTTSEGITVRTSGIQDSGVIDYLQETYGDGLTFEIWNYFNIEHSSWYEGDSHTSIEPDDLRNILNGSTVKFITNTPDLYVNAFNDTENGEIFEDDCTVSIVDEQIGYYPNNKTGYWYNGSPFNELYYKED